ncbi:hypothetical protein JCM8202_000251 [Rhodotorula sphaerocarpa]
MSAPSPSAAPLARNPVVSEPPLEACLLLAQAVAQHGTSDWDAIAQRIAQSEHWPAEAGQMTSQGYAGAFQELMRERGLDPKQCQEPLSLPSRRLVHMLYSTLLTSLRHSILTSFREEARLQEEIGAIRAGQRDQQLEQEDPAATGAGVDSLPASQDKADSTATAAEASSARKPASGGRATARKAPSAAAAAAAAESEPIVKAEDAGPSAPEPVAFEEEGQDAMQIDESAGAGKAEAAGEAEGEGDGEGDGDGDGETVEGEGEGEEPSEAEAEAEDEAKPKRDRPRKGRSSASQRGKKRKQSEPPATSPPPPAAGAGTAEDGNKRRKRVKTTEEPADVEEKDVKAATQRRKVAFTRLIEQLQEEKYSHYFESRVTKSIAPMYNVAVRRPTCLKDVLKAIKSGAISNSTELMRDVALLCANAIQFNGDEGDESVGHYARLLWERFERLADETLSTLLHSGDP